MANNNLNVRLKLKYDTEANWQSNNPVLLPGEVAISSDKNGRHKVGDGVTAWTGLSYAKADLSKSDVTTALGYTPPTTNTTYTTGTATYSGTTKLYTGTGTNTDGTMTQSAIKSALDGKSNSGHRHDNASPYVSTSSVGKDGFLSAQDKAKLDGIAANANNYIHPTTSGNKHIPSGGSAGQFLKYSADGTATWASDNDTKNTAGATDTASKIFLIGATGQSANPQTYSHDTVYVGTDGCLYSNNTKVSVDGHTHSYIPTSEKGKANGVASLDGNGKVPQTQLPSYVDDVLEGYLIADSNGALRFFEQNSNTSTNLGTETGKIYVNLSNNKTYRWSGTQFTVISETVAIGETTGTAFDGAKGAKAYAHAVTNKGTAFAEGLYKITTNSEGHVTGATVVGKGDITKLGIPAQDTTYSAFTGASASANGSQGLVPQPTAGNQGKFLRADGTWATPTDNDYRVKTDVATTTKAYLTGTTSSTSATGTLKIDTGVYLDTVAGKLVATTFSGNLSGNATSASKLYTARNFSITGGATASAVSFNGEGNVALNVTSVSTDVLDNGTNTLVLDCGTSAF